MLSVQLDWQPMDWTAGTAGERNTDAGVYYITACHPVHGPEALVYIGKTDRGFTERMVEHRDWLLTERSARAYVARVENHELISDVERLLIWTCSPCYCSHSVWGRPGFDTAETLQVTNHGQAGRLPFEMSTSWQELRPALLSDLPPRAPRRDRHSVGQLISKNE